jgi:N-acetylglucosamine-6-phosphate deacetylase
MNYFDLQVNGYGGVDFNSDGLSADDLHRACEMVRRDGVSQILATVITEALPQMCGRIARIVELREQDELAREVIAGFHIEGPWLNETPGFRGAHPPDAMRPANLDDAGRLLEAGAGLVKLVTLAPERDPDAATTKWLANRGVRVAGGHSDASLEDLERATDNGLSLWTHLGNGCPGTLARHDNVVQRVLSFSDRLWPCFIADGVHIPFFALRNYLRAADLSRCVVVSDAVAPAGLGPGTYSFARWTVNVGEDLAVRAPDNSHLVGSAVTMKQSVENLRTHLGLDDSAIAMLCETNPRRALEAN